MEAVRSDSGKREDDSMSLHMTPQGDRTQIAIYGKRNAGKSSLINAITGQPLAIVSDVKGTTTDPVSKAMEILPIGPCMLIDTPGLDDEGELGQKRIQKAMQVLNKTDIAIVVLDIAALSKEELESECGLPFKECEVLAQIEERKIPAILVLNQTDKLTTESMQQIQHSIMQKNPSLPVIAVSAKNGTGIQELKERIASLVHTGKPTRNLIRDLLHPGDLVIQVIPIDESAPKGRLILPQQMMIREVLESGAISIVCRETELEETLARFQAGGIQPAMVITDSQAFGLVSRLVPDELPLTSYSILMARYKGFLETAVRGVSAISTLKDGDRILISEGCTHHRQCGDIGTVKIPGWLHKCTGKSLEIETSSGLGFPEDLSKFKLVIHCGGCMLNEREVLYRQKSALDAGIPFTNYGITIAFMKGILKRSLGLFPELAKLVP